MPPERQTIGNRLQSVNGAGGGPFLKGEVVQYTDGAKGQVMARGVSVHLNDVEPYYSIQYLPDDVGTLHHHKLPPTVSATQKNGHADTRRSRRRQRR